MLAPVPGELRPPPAGDRAVRFRRAAPALAATAGLTLVEMLVTLGFFTGLVLLGGEIFVAVAGRMAGDAAARDLAVQQETFSARLSYLLRTAAQVDVYPSLASCHQDRRGNRTDHGTFAVITSAVEPASDGTLGPAVRALEFRRSVAPNEIVFYDRFTPDATPADARLVLRDAHVDDFLDYAIQRGVGTRNMWTAEPQPLSGGFILVRWRALDGRYLDTFVASGQGVHMQ